MRRSRTRTSGPPGRRFEWPSSIQISKSSQLSRFVATAGMPRLDIAQQAHTGLTASEQRRDYRCRQQSKCCPRFRQARLQRVRRLRTTAQRERSQLGAASCASELVELLTPGKNPFFEHAEAPVLPRPARRQGRRPHFRAYRRARADPAGRARALGPGLGQWGMLEAEDEETAHALIAARRRLAARARA